MKQTSLFPDPAAERREAHTCHARGCDRHIKPELLMCPHHWRLVHPTIQRAVWSNYRAGQCDDMAPSKFWIRAADAAIGYVARLEGKPVTRNEAAALENFK
jgi:hypothetical protein